MKVTFQFRILTLRNQMGETSRLPIPDIVRPSTSKELEQNFCLMNMIQMMNQGIKKIKGSDTFGPAIDKELAEILNEFVISGTTISGEMLREKFIRPYNVDNLQVPKVSPDIKRHISDKGKATDAAVQKAVT